jgi:hypothetical protein
MRNLFLFSILILLVNQKNYSQISFIGFDKDQCGIVENKKISFVNYNSMCDSHSSGYRIFSDGVQIFEKCESLSGHSILDLKFVSETTGFLIESNSNGHTIYKTTDTGKSWNPIGGGAPTFLGFYIVNANTGYLVTTWNSPLNIYITRVSDVKSKSISDSKIKNDTIINDTIFGSGFCNYKSLSFKIKNSNDTINYQISFKDLPLNIHNVNNRLIGFYPNPANDYIQILQDINTPNDCKIRISDTNGRLIRSFNNSQDKLYVGDLERGCYIIEFVDKDNRLFYKMIKN